VVWLGQKTGKPVLKLVDSDYTENGLGELLTGRGTRAYQLNIEVFNTTQHTITGWPGGKPDADDSHRPERSSPHPKRVLVLAPEPQDDVLCLGGTLNRLVHQGHDVKVACLTSGNLAVPDEEVLRAAETLVELAGDEPAAGRESVAMELADAVRCEIAGKEPLAEDSERLRHFKAVIRRGEARFALRHCGVAPAQIVFLDLPFYERGHYRQFQPAPDDAARVRALLDEFRPHQVFLTGVQSDPSSLDAVTFSVIREGLAANPRPQWLEDCRFWVYRGGGEAWSIDLIDMAVPLSPDELALKLQAIYQHRTQRSQAPLGAGGQEAWRQAEENDRHTAQLYDKLGLAEYEAIETFMRWNP
jgi:glucosamine-6-phosphate deaminase